MLQKVQPVFKLNLFFVRAKISHLILKSMPNIKSQIMLHNRKMLKEERTDIKLCTCGEKCVIDNKYLLQNVTQYVVVSKVY